MELNVVSVGIVVAGVTPCIPMTYQKGRARRVYFWYRDPEGTASREVLSINLDTERVHRSARLRNESLANIKTAINMFGTLRELIEEEWGKRHKGK